MTEESSETAVEPSQLLGPGSDYASLPVAQAIILAARRVGVVAKDGEHNTGYPYRRVEDLINNLAPIIHEIGLFFVPTLIEDSLVIEQMNGRKPGWSIVRTRVKFAVYGPMGDRLDDLVEGIGYGADNEDKGPGKAVSYAFKTAVSILLMIPTREMQDNEATVIPEWTPEPVRVLSPWQRDQIGALFDACYPDDEDERRKAKYEWIATLPFPFNTIPERDFQAVYNSARAATADLTAELSEPPPPSGVIAVDDQPPGPVLEYEDPNNNPTKEIEDDEDLIGDHGINPSD